MEQQRTQKKKKYGKKTMRLTRAERIKNEIVNTGKTNTQEKTATTNKQENLYSKSKIESSKCVIFQYVS